MTVLNKDELAVVVRGPRLGVRGLGRYRVRLHGVGGSFGDNLQYAYAWTARGDTQDTALLSATDIASPVFYVPDEVAATTTYEYLLTASAENAEDGHGGGRR